MREAQAGIKVSLALLHQLLLLPEGMEILGAISGERDLTLLVRGEGCPQDRPGEVVLIAPVYRRHPDPCVERIDIHTFDATL